MQALVFCYALFMASALLLLLWRVSKTSYNTLGKWTKWVVLLMVIAAVLTPLSTITTGIIIGLMTLIINAVIPIIGSAVAPLIEAMSVIITCLLFTMIVAIPIVGIIIGYYKGRCGLEPYPPYERSKGSVDG